VSWTEAPHIVLATVIEREGSFLFVEELVSGTQVINQPAGHWEPGETFVEGAVRETLEETAWHVTVTDLIGIYVHQPQELDYPFVRLTFAARAERFDDGRTLDTGIMRTHWWTEAELRQHSERHRSPLVQRCVADYQAGRRLPLDALQHL
jgi:8-oxo-dGTP pyrophosphatase MutT (NUDIX family)